MTQEEKALTIQASRPEFNPQDTHVGSGETASRIILRSACMPWHAHAHRDRVTNKIEPSL